jgi:hypothetical protein
MVGLLGADSPVGRCSIGGRRVGRWPSRSHIDDHPCVAARKAGDHAIPMDERGIGAFEAAAEADRAQFFGAGIAPERPRDAGAEPDAMRLPGGSTGRNRAPGHLNPVRRGALGGEWCTWRVGRGRVLSETPPCRTSSRERAAARIDARTLRTLGGEVMWKCSPGDDGGLSPGNEGGVLPSKRVRRRPSPHKRISRVRGRSFDCDFGAACKVSRLARGSISSSASPAARASDNLRHMGYLGCTRLAVSVALDPPFQKMGVRGRAPGAAANTGNGGAE